MVQPVVIPKRQAVAMEFFSVILKHPVHISRVVGSGPEDHTRRHKHRLKEDKGVQEATGNYTPAQFRVYQIISHLAGILYLIIT